MHTLKNDSIPLTNQIFLTKSRLCSLDFNEDEILKIIKDLNIHKTHRHDDISIRMIKICAKLLLTPLFLLFHNSINLSCCSDIWKGSNTISIQRELQTVKKYRPVSLLPMFVKVFEKIIFNTLYCNPYFGVLLDEKLNCKQHVDNAIMKVNQCIPVIKKRGIVCPEV